MLEEGLVEEVKNVMSKYTMSKTALQGLGYKEVIEFLNNDISYDEMVDKLKMETRRYAKRQLTWFSRNKEIKWYDINNIADKIIMENK
jgi:tRNA dimethylallyltransferase